MRIYSWLNTASQIITSYNGDNPFAHYLKQFFADHKKYGSRDRRLISHLCYSYFRLGHAFNEKTVEDRILIAQYLVSDLKTDFTELFPEAWSQSLALPLPGKFEIIGSADEWQKIFPLKDHVSKEIDIQPFIYSHLLQPDVYLRLRPGMEAVVEKKLREAELAFTHISRECISISNATKADKVIELDKEAVVQDINSQRVISLVKDRLHPDKRMRVWDCCAASGGKSLLFFDHIPTIELTVSDIRVSILHNLRNRFKRAGLHHYTSFVADLSITNPVIKGAPFDLVICDAPCSGSGTWGRTPEQLQYFKKDRIAHYSNLQKTIASNVSGYVKKGGFFLYITCSVFTEENEEVVAHLQNNTPLQLEAVQYFKGYNNKADTLFAALFTIA
ncbi:MAG TPA: Fmu (Sun) domain-containing protein [Chitinophagaceae bacterium]